MGEGDYEWKKEEGTQVGVENMRWAWWWADGAFGIELQLKLLRNGHHVASILGPANDYDC